MRPSVEVEQSIRYRENIKRWQALIRDADRQSTGNFARTAQRIRAARAERFAQRRSVDDLEVEAMRRAYDEL